VPQLWYVYVIYSPIPPPMTRLGDDASLAGLHGGRNDRAAGFAQRSCRRPRMYDAAWWSQPPPAGVRGLLWPVGRSLGGKVGAAEDGVPRRGWPQHGRGKLLARWSRHGRQGPRSATAAAGTEPHTADRSSEVRRCLASGVEIVRSLFSGQPSMRLAARWRSSPPFSHSRGGARSLIILSP
jgi:hypothetical protein